MWSPLERREDVPSLGSGEFRRSRAVHIYVDVSTVFHYCDSPRTDALRQVRSTGKQGDSLFLCARCTRVNLRARGRAGTLSRVLSGFIASPCGTLDRCRRLCRVQLSIWPSKFFEDRDRGICNFPPSINWPGIIFYFWDINMLTLMEFLLA